MTFRSLISILALTVGLNGLSQANILVNSSFETPVIGNTNFQLLGTGSNALTGWTVTGTTCALNCVAILDTNYVESTNIGQIRFNAEAGIQSLDLSGAGNTLDGGIQQTVNLSVGTTYLLTFWVGNMDNRAHDYPLQSSVELLINGTSLGIFTNNASTNNLLNWAQSSFNFAATQASNTIQFRNATAAGDFEAGLDNVSLDAVAGVPNVPEPGTLWLMALALMGTAPFLRRRGAI